MKPSRFNTNRQSILNTLPMDENDFDSAQMIATQAMLASYDCHLNEKRIDNEDENAFFILGYN